MAANLTPQYLEAEARYRAARTPDEQLAALEEMWRELPKHKSSEKIQAELKKKLSAARKAVQAGARHGATKTDPFAVPKTGAGQVVLLGTPNTGKSSLVGGLTHAHVRIADYPFATALPVPGMVPYQDIQIQLVDTPPVTAEHVPPGMAGLWRTADALAIVADAASDACLDDVETCLRHLAERRIELVDGPRVRPEEPEAPLRVPGVVLANKADVPGASATVDMVRELLGGRVRVEALSARDPALLGRLPELLFRLIRVVRVYAKPPGRKPDLAEPFVLPAGSDVHELARRVYRGFEQKIRAARIWGHGVADGQNVQLDHVLYDRDIVELHA
ncbi:MAG: GTPase [Planctomycetota bacterium]